MANNPPYSSLQPLQPPLVSSMDPPRNFIPPMPMQFRPVIPTQQSQQFIPVASPNYQPVGRGVPVNTGLPSHPPQPQYPQSVQQLPGRPGQPGPGPPQSQVIPLPNALPNRHLAPGSSLPPPSVPTPINYATGLGGPGAPLSSSYTFAPPSYGHPPVAFSSVTQYQPMTHLHAPNIPSGGQAGPALNQNTAPVMPVQPNGEQSSVTSTNASTVDVQPTKPMEVPATDWKEHASANGRRYYYNKKTRQSSWEKPFELMTPIERADASTDWKEFTNTDGRKYYYNKVTKQSKWEIPEELKLARERVDKASTMETQVETSADSHSRASVFPAVDKTLSNVDAPSITARAEPSSPVSVAPVAAPANSQSQSVPESSASPVPVSSITSNPDEVQKTENPTSGSLEVTATGVDTATTKINNFGNFSGVDDPSSANNASTQDKEEVAKDVPIPEKFTIISSEEKAVNQEPLTYADKLEAKNVFKSLLESTNVASDWNWEQAMRLIINDRRYGALRTLGERKQAFNEYLGQKKKQEVEERRSKQKRAKEEFRNMLEESGELTSSTRWSKAVTILENDERFKAVERERDRKDLYDTFVQELGEKEKAKLQEERKRNIAEYRQFLESCDFIKASTQWRKVQDRLEADERCIRLEKIDRLEIFQDYLRDLDKEEEEQRKIQKEELRKAERKNRDEFRKLLEEHVAAGTLTAKTNWRDYYLKVKDLPAYLAVASNSSGSTPKDLFEDVAEELQKQYQEDKGWIKDAVKLKKVALASTWTFEDFKASIMEDLSPTISDVNQKIIFDELIEKAKEKEEKEAKKRRRLSEDFLNLLHSIKEITASSKWEDCKDLFEGSREFSSIGEESICMDIFEEYISQLKENERKRKEEKAKKEKEREERDRRKGKHRKDKERGHEREKEHTRREEADSDHTDIAEDYTIDSKRSGSDSNKKQRRRHHDSMDDLNEGEKDRSKSSHRHSSEHRKSRRHASTPDSDGESRHKRHRRDHRNGSRRNGSHDELEDGEFGDSQ